MNRFHPKNFHQGNYDFKTLVDTEPSLKDFVIENAQLQLSIDFANPNAVKALNKAILTKDYGIQFWEIPDGYLCAPIPGRAEYIHRIADLLGMNNTPSNLTVLDIGTGANCIYPIIGTYCYNWNFIGSDIDVGALENVRNIVAKNYRLQNKVDIRKQANKNYFFNGIVSPKEIWDITICNPPFHDSAESASRQTSRKVKNLTGQKSPDIILNFGGQQRELWCQGGEVSFITKMMKESLKWRKNCFWFTCLVSQRNHLNILDKISKELPLVQYKIIEWENGNKQTRFIAWSFLTPQQQKEWKLARWTV